MKEQANQYVFDRLTCLISVAFPALLIGFELARLGAAFTLDPYKGFQYNALPLWETLVRGLTFSSERTGQAARLGSNGPYWSLSHEAVYYALFGFAALFETSLGRSRDAMRPLAIWWRRAVGRA